jgi:hypothetical protein
LGSCHTNRKCPAGIVGVVVLAGVAGIVGIVGTAGTVGTVGTVETVVVGVGQGLEGWRHESYELWLLADEEEIILRKDKMPSPGCCRS